MTFGGLLIVSITTFDLALLAMSWKHRKHDLTATSCSHEATSDETTLHNCWATSKYACFYTERLPCKVLMQVVSHRLGRGWARFDRETRKVQFILAKLSCRNFARPRRSTVSDIGYVDQLISWAMLIWRKVTCFEVHGNWCLEGIKNGNIENPIVLKYL